MKLPSMHEALEAIDAWMSEAAPKVRAAHSTASAEDLERLATFGDATADLIALYRRFGGTTDWQPFWEGNELVPPQSAIALREMMNGHENGGVFYRWMPGEWWNPRWLPFLDNHSYDMYCIDLDTGEVVLWSKDSAARPALAPSLATWLGLIVLGSREGLVEWDADAGAQAVTPTLGQLNRLHKRVMPGYPTARVARMRRDVEGEEPPPRPPALVEGCTVSRQWWAPSSASVHALAFLPTRGVLAVGQYDWGEAPGGLSLVDPETGEVVEVILEQPVYRRPPSTDGARRVRRLRRHGQHPGCALGRAHRVRQHPRLPRLRAGLGRRGRPPVVGRRGWPARRATSGLVLRPRSQHYRLTPMPSFPRSSR